MNTIRGFIDADELIVGEDVYVGEGAVLCGPQPGVAAKRIILGDHCHIGDGTRVYATEFRIGEYSTWRERGLANGPGPLQIGRGCWIGRDVNLNPEGGLYLDDGAGVGEGSQLWTHIRFGDVVEGCRFDGAKPMVVGRDAWFVGHCLVSPVTVAPKAMALLGSVVTKDMAYNRVYGGNPARDLTDKLGPPYAARTLAEKAARLGLLIERFVAAHPQYDGRYAVAFGREDYEREARRLDGDALLIDVARRAYRKCGSPAEVAFLKWAMPRLKVTPAGEPAFVELPTLHLESDDETQEVVIEVGGG